MKPVKHPVIIIGAGGHARVVIDTVKLIGLHIQGILDVEYRDQNETILGINVLGGLEYLEKMDRPLPVFIAIGDNVERTQIFHQVLKMNNEILSLVHPTAIVSPHVQIGRGVLVNAGAVINAGAIIGDNVIVNTGALIDHETIIGEHSHIAPGACIAGRVTVGQHVFVGIGASVIDKMTIGDHVVVGAGSVVIRDVPDHETVVGVPARKLK